MRKGNFIIVIFFCGIFVSACAGPVPAEQAAVTNEISLAVNEIGRTQENISFSICFPRPASGQAYTVWKMSVEAKGEVLAVQSEPPTSFMRVMPPDPSMTCQALLFNVGRVLDEHGEVALVIHEIGLPLSALTEDYACNPAVLDAVRAHAKAEGWDVVIGCEDTPGFDSIQIFNEPQNISREDAEQAILKFLLRVTTGPWVFRVE